MPQRITAQNGVAVATNNYAQRSRKLKLPPYVYWGIFKASLCEMKAAGLPEKVTVRAFPKVSLAMASQLTQAYRRLGLLDELRAPTTTLIELVAAFDTRNWARTLSALLHKVYPQILSEKGPYSREQLNVLFAKLYEGQPSVHRKAVPFLLSAMDEACIPIVGGDFGFRGRPSKKARQATTPYREDTQQTPQSRSPYDLLMNEIYDPRVIKEGSQEEQAILTLARFFKLHQ